MICPAAEASSQAWPLHYDTLKQKSHLKFGKRGGGVLSFVSAVSSLVREAVSAATFEAEGCVVREAVSTAAFDAEGGGVDGGKERGDRGANPKRGGGIHLVIWEEITKAKSKKGLGFRCMEDMNEAFLTKLGWSKSRCERKARNTSTTLMDWLSCNINKITKVVMGVEEKDSLAFEAETWGVLTGIKMAKELGAGKVILESDAHEVISALRLKKETWETGTIC
nr:uncharacterized protein LOC109162339 [Ipomoea trifida]